MDKSHLNIDVVSLQQGYRVDRGRLGRIAGAVLRAEGVRSADVEIAVVSDQRIARVNASSLGHRGPTDVLSFDLSDNQDARVPAGPASTAKTQAKPVAVTGQIIISADTARRQARRFRHAISAELALYVIHGLLHLLGYDDLSEPGRSRMHRRQRELAERLGCRLNGY